MAGYAHGARLQKDAALLGWAGALPFILFAITPWLALPALAVLPFLTGAVAYGAMILSFQVGIRFAAGMGEDGLRPGEIFITVLPALAGWTALALPPLPGLGLLIAAFLLDGQREVVAVEQGRVPSRFGKIRMLLTAAAVVSLLALLLRLLI